MNPLMHVGALALWSSDYAHVAAWHAGQRRSQAEAPPAELLPIRARGRASLLTRMLVEVVSQVGSDGQIELAELPLIIGSGFGEMETTVQLLQMMSTGDGALSPARFQASVHNTGAGQISIAASCRGFSSCLAAGDATSAAVLAEAHAWLSTHAGQVIVAVADETLPTFFSEREHGYGPLAAAMLLSALPIGRVLATLGPPLPAPETLESPSPRDAGEAFAHNPVTPLLGVLRAILASSRQTVALPGISGSWRVEVVPSEETR